MKWKMDLTTMRSHSQAHVAFATPICRLDECFTTAPLKSVLDATRSFFQLLSHHF